MCDIDAQYRPQGSSSSAAGIGDATSGSITDKLTRDHRMTLDEAQLILNIKQGDPLETVVQVRYLSQFMTFAENVGDCVSAL